MILIDNALKKRQQDGKPIRVAMVGTGHGHALSKQKALASMAEYDFVGASAEPSEIGRAHV